MARGKTKGAVDKKPRKRRTDNPQKYLPPPDQRSKVGRKLGSRNGWTAEEQRQAIANAQFEARILCRVHDKVGYFPMGTEADRVLAWLAEKGQSVPYPNLREERAARLARKEARRISYGEI